MTTKTDEQERAKFETWAIGRFNPLPSFAPKQDRLRGILEPRQYDQPMVQLAWEAYQAGRAALQSQDREDAPCRS